MFGYVRIFKPHMKFCEYDLYKGVYCGLCKKLGKDFGLVSRMTLSYDFTFLALMQLAVNKKEVKLCQERCIAHPFKKTICVTTKEDVSFSANMAVLLMYHKLKDDLADKDFKKKLIALSLIIPAKRAYKKAVKTYPQMSNVIEECLKQQAQLEADKCKSIDMACEPSANMMSAMAEQLSDDEKDKILLKRFGYLIGRYVYICDAYDDLADDFKKGNYNPFLLHYEMEKLDEGKLEMVREYAIDSVNFTLGELANTYVLLDIDKYKAVLDNIIYLGLKNAFSLIIKKEKESDK